MKPAGLVPVVVVLAALAGCTAREPVPQTAPRDVADAAVARRPIPESPPPPSVPPAARAEAKPAQITVPADAQYVCVAETDGERTQTAITFSPRVAQLCRRHPEMGPCQYERNLCRKSGGRVYAQGGVEITMDTEAEYDRRVMRVRFKSN
jgi:hypothetical protein